jgi:hypothetical protein
MSSINGQDVRNILLEIIQENKPSNANESFQANTVLREAATKLNIINNNEKEQILLTEWYDLFRIGYLAWGYNLCNSNPPFCHLTDRGIQVLGNFKRDPSNPSGYLQHLNSKAKINDISLSYLKEGLECYVAGSFKASAVMIGAASESVVLELRDITAAKIKDKGDKFPDGIDDWRIRTILVSLKTFFDSKKKHLDKSLKEEYEAYWAAYAQQIRAVRNEAGHPSSIEPITSDTVHASFLIFPELAYLAQKLKNWVENNYQ